MPIRRTCPLCFGDDHYPVARATAPVEELRAVVCRDCGLVFVNPMFTPEEKSSLVSSVRWLHRSGSADRTWEGAFRQLRHRARRCMELLRPHLKPGDRVLEIGSGDGAVLAELKALGMRATGLEPDQAAALRVERSLQTTVIPGSIEDTDLDGSRFDAAVLVHVLEHLYDPVEVLVKLRRCLKPRGLLFVEAPNVLRPKVGPRRVFSFAHNYHFSPRTMALALSEAGFGVTALRIFSHDSFQVVAHALPAGAKAARLCGDSWRQVAAAIRAHRVRYLATLQFLWRKVPGLREKLLYGGYRDLSGIELARWLNAVSDGQDRGRQHRELPQPPVSSENAPVEDAPPGKAHAEQTRAAAV